MVSKLKSPQKASVIDELEEEYQAKNPQALDTQLAAKSLEGESSTRRAAPKRKMSIIGKAPKTRTGLVRRNFDIQASTDQSVDILQLLLRRKDQNYTKGELYDLLLQKGLATFKELQNF